MNVYNYELYCRGSLLRCDNSSDLILMSIYTYVAESINSELLDIIFLIDSATYYSLQDWIATGYYAVHLTKS